MPKRLPVVLCASRSSSPSQQQMEQQLVARLTVESGIQLNLIPDLNELSDDDSGRLCLEGIPGDMALLGWLPVDRIFAALAQLGISGRRGTDAGGLAQPTDPNALRLDAASTRTIYGFDLAQAEGAERVIVRLRQIRDAQPERGGTAARSADRGPVLVELTRPASRGLATDRDHAPPAETTAGSSSSPQRATSSTAAPASPPAAGDVLDHLLDELDAFDL